jgi:hypothetical protein
LKTNRTARGGEQMSSMGKSLLILTAVASLVLAAISASAMTKEDVLADMTADPELARTMSVIMLEKMGVTSEVGDVTVYAATTIGTDKYWVATAQLFAHGKSPHGVWRMIVSGDLERFVIEPEAVWQQCVAASAILALEKVPQ